MATKVFNVPDLGEVFVYKRRGSKNIRISLTHEGKVRVTIPSWAPYRAALAFVHQKQSWIREQKVERSGFLAHTQRIGKYHTLYMSPDPTASAIRTRTSNNSVTVQYPPAQSHTSDEVQTAARRAAQKALKQQAEQLLPQRLETLADQYSFSYTDCSIRHLKSRWGSCNSKKEITLNYFLMQLPWRLIDYVLVHELSHTKHLNHSPAFWHEVAQYIPDYKERKKELRTYQPSVLTV